jgi:hypothetical protein
MKRMLTERQVSERTAKMIAVSWALVLFDCTITGGFVRDWIVNGEEHSKPGEPSIPSNIDADMSIEKQFNLQAFLSLMQKLDIKTSHKHYGWGLSLIFGGGLFNASII